MNRDYDWHGESAKHYTKGSFIRLSVANPKRRATELNLRSNQLSCVRIRWRGDQTRRDEQDIGLRDSLSNIAAVLVGRVCRREISMAGLLPTPPNPPFPFSYISVRRSCTSRELFENPDSITWHPS